VVQLKDGGSLRRGAGNWWSGPGRKLTCRCPSFHVDQSNGRHEHRTALIGPLPLPHCAALPRSLAPAAAPAAAVAAAALLTIYARGRRRPRATSAARR